MTAPRKVLFVCSRNRLRSSTASRFKAHLGGKRIVFLEIPDDYAYMDPERVCLLPAKVPRHLG